MFAELEPSQAGRVADLSLRRRWNGGAAAESHKVLDGGTRVSACRQGERDGGVLAQAIGRQCLQNQCLQPADGGWGTAS